MLYTQKILSIENADYEQRDLFGVLKNLNKGKKPPEKVSFLKDVRTLLEARQDVLNNLESNTFPIKSDTAHRETSINEEFSTGETSSQQKEKELKILTPKQMLQRLPKKYTTA